ncbi:hypothetical protein ACFTAO_50275 [Paenibacillus rhizoplanae]
MEEGKWADDAHVIYPDMEGNILSADVTGKQETIVKTGIPYVHEVVQTGSRILYVTGEDSQLSAYDTVTKQTKVLRKRCNLGGSFSGWKSAGDCRA